MTASINPADYFQPRVAVRVANPYAVILVVARAFAVTVAELLGPRRFPVVVTARHAAMYLLRELGETLHAIGRAMHRDHTTVLHGVRRAVVALGNESFRTRLSLARAALEVG